MVARGTLEACRGFIIKYVHVLVCLYLIRALTKAGSSTVNNVLKVSPALQVATLDFKFISIYRTRDL